MEVDTKRHLNIDRYVKQGWDLERINEYVADKMGVEPEQLKISVAKIARYLKVSSGAVPQMLVSGEKISKAQDISILTLSSAVYLL
ncbi:unnamed protein product [marine sediment metagenome]|uniref:Uncharacterized protein n=1 Tax=marine sediment metagenome TaxID=412755 RepID=X0W186_9ZZZZ